MKRLHQHVCIVSLIRDQLHSAYISKDMYDILLHTLWTYILNIEYLLMMIMK